MATNKKEMATHKTTQASPKATKTTSKAKPKATTQQASEALQVNVSFDPGNRTLQLWDGKQFIQMPSRFLKLIGNRRPKKVGSDSTLITIERAPSNRFTGETYLIGEDCKRYSDHKRVFDGNKLENAGLYLVALVTKAYPKVAKVNLKVAVNLTEGDIPEFADEIVKSLKGSFKVIVEGTQSEIKVTTVKVFEEGLGPWNLYQQTNSQPNDIYRGVINLGGSTLDGILLDSEGMVIEDSAFRSSTGGTTDLATRIKDVVIYDDPSLSGVNIDVFMDNIANGSFEFNGTPFKHIYDEVFPEWFNGAISQIQRRWAQHYHLIETIIFTGGSSYLVQDRIKGNPKFYLTPDPSADNCKGLLNL